MTATEAIVEHGLRFEPGQIDLLRGAHFRELQNAVRNGEPIPPDPGQAVATSFDETPPPEFVVETPLLAVPPGDEDVSPGPADELRELRRTDGTVALLDPNGTPTGGPNGGLLRTDGTYSDGPPIFGVTLRTDGSIIEDERLDEVDDA